MGLVRVKDLVLLGKLQGLLNESHKSQDNWRASQGRLERIDEA